MKTAIKKELITWARARAGLEIEDLMSRFPKIGDWESGIDSPTLNQLQNLALRLAAPIGYFFLTEPPKEDLPISDFRSADGDPIEDPSPELLDTVYAMQRRQEWYKDFVIDEGAEPLSFVGSATMNESPMAVAEAIHRELDIMPGWAEEIPTWTQALDDLGMRAEQLGILLVWNGVVGNNTHRKLDVKEFRGFAMPDSYAPLIFINNSDFKSAQMFTLAHELAHIWLGSAGVSNLENLIPTNNATEIFCNKVAAEFLVPAQEIGAALRRNQGADDLFQILARRFKVSEIVVARRALDLGYINRDEFIEFYSGYISAERAKKSSKKPGGDFYANCNYKIGRPFAEAVVRATAQGKLLYRDAYKLTGLRGITFDKYFNRVRAEAS
jgi:Zn-dependent peptidase ImmA (M78 family)/transcriptional regulator with XRE-family HTH domain